jgi:hypothetical protein
VPFRGSVDSTTVQNIVIIAIASILQRKSSYIGLQPYEYIAQSIVAISLHLHQVPQANMLECKLEILLLVPYSIIKTCTFEYAAPEGSVQ